MNLNKIIQANAYFFLSFKHCTSFIRLLYFMKIIHLFLNNNLVKKIMDNEILSAITILLIFLMVIITQIFLISLIMVLLKKIKLIMCTTPKKYYYFVLFYIISKMALCIFLEVKIILNLPDELGKIDSDSIEPVFKTSIIFADCAIIELFLISFQHYLALSFSILGNQKIQRTIKILMQGVQLLTFFMIMIPLLIFNLGILDYAIINTVVTVLNCLSVAAFLTSFFYMNFKMTGVLMEIRSTELIKKVYKLLLTILLSRVIMAGLQILIQLKINSGGFETFISLIERNQGQYVTLGACFILYMLIILLTEGLPLMISLREAVVMAFMQKNHSRKSSQISDESGFREELLESMDLQPPQKTLDQTNILQQVERIDNISRLQKVVAMEQYSIYKGSYKDCMLFIRLIKNISTYITEEIVQELQFLSKLNIPDLNPVRIITSQECIYLIQPYLETTLKQKMQQLNEQGKIDLAIKIAEAIKNLHDERFAHGSLTPSNIMFQSGKVKITGYGLESLRKYLSLTADYTNLSMYTAVELLGSRKKTVLKPSKEADVYSFGIILYQLITKNFKYRELSVQDIRKKFKEENIRPKIPQQINQKIKKIMRICWQENPKNRPKIQDIIMMLQNVSVIQ